MNSVSNTDRANITLDIVRYVSRVVGAHYAGININILDNTYILITLNQNSKNLYIFLKNFCNFSVMRYKS